MADKTEEMEKLKQEYDTKLAEAQNKDELGKRLR